MKKALKVLGILCAIGAVVAAVLLYLKKIGYFDDCDMDCENCDNDCLVEDEFDEREYTSIQPNAAREKSVEEAVAEAIEEELPVEEEEIAAE